MGCDLDTFLTTVYVTIDELYQAVVNGRPPLRNGAWAMATVEVLLAMLRSAREGSDVHLNHQVALS